MVKNHSTLCSVLRVTIQNIVSEALRSCFTQHVLDLFRHRTDSPTSLLKSPITPCALRYTAGTPMQASRGRCQPWATVTSQPGSTKQGRVGAAATQSFCSWSSCLGSQKWLFPYGRSWLRFFLLFYYSIVFQTFRYLAIKAKTSPLSFLVQILGKKDLPHIVLLPKCVPSCGCGEVTLFSLPQGP